LFLFGSAKGSSGIISAIMTTQTAETTFYTDDQGIRVTNSRLVFGDTTYSMANLTSVAVKRPPTNYGVLIVLLIFVLVWVFGLTVNQPSLSGAGGIGTVVVAGAFFISIALKKWNLTITSSSGESSPISSRDKRYIDRIAQAIQEALIARG
jgi:hypothetical protein